MSSQLHMGRKKLKCIIQYKINKLNNTINIYKKHIYDLDNLIKQKDIELSKLIYNIIILNKKIETYKIKNEQLYNKNITQEEYYKNHI